MKQQSNYCAAAQQMTCCNNNNVTSSNDVDVFVGNIGPVNSTTGRVLYQLNVTKQIDLFVDDRK